MRKLIAMVAVLGTTTGCASGGRGADLDGRPSPQLAVEAFLQTAKQQDLAGMARVWGSAKGPASATMERGELEKREMIIQCHLRHDSARVVGDFAGDGGRRVYRVDLTKGGVTKTTSVTTVQGPNGRWFVESADIEKTSEFCRSGLGPG